MLVMNYRLPGVWHGETLIERAEIDSEVNKTTLRL